MTSSTEDCAATAPATRTVDCHGWPPMCTVTARTAIGWVVSFCTVPDMLIRYRPGFITVPPASPGVNVERVSTIAGTAPVGQDTVAPSGPAIVAAGAGTAEGSFGGRWFAATAGVPVAGRLCTATTPAAATTRSAADPRSTAGRGKRGGWSGVIAALPSAPARAGSAGAGGPRA